MSQYSGPSTWSAGGYIKETQPTKKRRNRYHAKRNPADPPEDGAVKQHALPRVKLEDGAVEQHAPPLASEAGAAEPLLITTVHRL